MNGSANRNPELLKKCEMAAYRKVSPPFFMLSFSVYKTCGLGMRYFNWLWRSIMFIVLLGFAVKNNQPVTLRYFFDTEWHTSLVVVLLLFFSAGVMIGVLAMMFSLIQQRKEMAGLKHGTHAHQYLADVEATRTASNT